MLVSRYTTILAVIILMSLLLYPLYIARAVSGWLIVLKEYVLDLIARLITRILLSSMENNIVGKILTGGRLGGPAFIQDWRAFLQGGQYRGEDITRAMIANITLGGGATACPYLRQSLALSYNVKGLVSNFDPDKYRLSSLQPFKYENKCTLPAGLNINSYLNDFSLGGWAAWDKLIQPQNNFFGIYRNSFNELEKQRGFEEGIDLDEGTAGSGFTGKRSDCEGTGPNSAFQCVILGKVLTPGQLFSDSSAATIDRELDWLVSSDELEEVLITAVATIVSRLENYAFGAAVSAVKNVDSGGSAAPPDPAGRAQQDCVDACIASNCPAALPACIYDPITGEPTNRPCDPADPDPRDACVANCQAQGCQ